MSLAITFDSTGAGHCLYSELIDLAKIGSLHIARASQIEFCNETKLWEVRDLQGQLLFTNTSRALCLAWEQQHFT